MSVSDLTSTTQDYLKAIWSQTEWADAPVTTKALAERLGVTPSSVSEAVRKLAAQGLVSHARYGAISLTEEGQAHAVAMVRRHRLIETFLVEYLGYTWDEVHDEAEHLEHAVSPLFVERLDERLGFPERDPHGDPIPSAAGEAHLPEAEQLTRAEAGARLIVVRINDDDPDMLRHFARCGVRPDAAIEVVAREPYAGGLSVRVTESGEVHALGEVATDAIWARPLS